MLILTPIDGLWFMTTDDCKPKIKLILSEQNDTMYHDYMCCTRPGKEVLMKLSWMRYAQIGAPSSIVAPHTGDRITDS